MSRHQLVPFGKTEQACISYRHIDKAIEQAKHKLKFRELSKKRKKANQSAALPPPPPFDIIHSSLEPPEDLVAAIGEINMATTQILADQFDLSNDELLNGLPLIDMSKTKFWSICPLFVKQDIKCKLTRYRTFTAHCNNLKHPTWGAAKTPFARYLPPVHPDGIWVPRKSIVTEVTFELSEGHRETHSNISPSMARAVFEDDSNNNVHDHEHIHRELEEMAGSVRFLQHAEPDGSHSVSKSQLHQSSRSIHHSSSSGLGQPFGNLMSDSSVRHYQQSHSPAREFAASSTPLVAASTNSAPRKGRSVALELPSARLVTSIVHRDVDVPAHDFTILFMSWGQLLDHDMTRAAQSPSCKYSCTVFMYIYCIVD